MVAAIAIIAVAASVVDIVPVVARNPGLTVEDMNIVVHLPDNFLKAALVPDILAHKAGRAAVVEAGSTAADCLVEYRAAAVADSRVIVVAGY